MKKFISSVLVGFIAVPTYGQTARTVDADFVTRNYGERNYVINNGAEINTANVTVTGSGSPTVTRSTTTPLMGVADFAVDLKQALDNRATWTLNAFDNALKNGNCQATFKVDNVVVGTGAVLKARVIQNSVSVGEIPVIAGTNPMNYSINFPCGDLTFATTFELRLTTGGSSNTTLNIDDIRIGSPSNLAQVAQAEFVGSVRYDQATNCAWTRTGTGSNVFGNFAADPDCMTPIVRGQANTSAGKIPGGTFTNLKPGNYRIVASFTSRKDGPNDEGVSYRLTDGTNFGIPSSPYATTGVATTFQDQINSVMEIQYIQPQASLTFQVQALTIDTSNTVWIRADSAASFPGFLLSVYRYPLDSELAVTPEQQAVLAAGEVFAWAGTTCPTGSIAANGASLNRADYPQLFAAIGTAHGTASGTTFNVPDYRGRFLRGVDGGTARDPNAATRTAMATGGNTGNNVGSIQGHAANVSLSGSTTFASSSHQHISTTGNVGSTQYLNPVFGTSTSPGGPAVYTFSGLGGPFVSSGMTGHLTDSPTSTATVSLTGGGGSETRPINAYVNYCIRTVTGGSGNAVYIQGPVKAAGTGVTLTTEQVGYSYTYTFPATLVISQTSPVSTTVYPSADLISNIPAGTYIIAMDATQADCVGTQVSRIAARFQDTAGNPISGWSGGVSSNTGGAAVTIAPYAIYTSSSTFNLRLGLRQETISGTCTEVNIRNNYTTSLGGGRITVVKIN